KSVSTCRWNIPARQRGIHHHPSSVPIFGKFLASNATPGLSQGETGGRLVLCSTRPCSNICPARSVAGVGGKPVPLGGAANVSRAGRVSGVRDGSIVSAGGICVGSAGGDPPVRETLPLSGSAHETEHASNASPKPTNTRMMQKTFSADLLISTPKHLFL